MTTVWGKVEAEIQKGKQYRCPGKKSRDLLQEDRPVERIGSLRHEGLTPEL